MTDRDCRGDHKDAQREGSKKSGIGQVGTWWPNFRDGMPGKGVAQKTKAFEWIRLNGGWEPHEMGQKKIHNKKRGKRDSNLKANK